MKDNLWIKNTPQKFWQLQTFIDAKHWRKAIQNALPLIGLKDKVDDLDDIPRLTLGEKQFGSNPWKLSIPKKVYYELKPILPRQLTKVMRQLYGENKRENFLLGWPLEDRYTQYLWEISRQLLKTNGKESFPFTSFWPSGYSYAFVLTHDIETAQGQSNVRSIMRLETKLGFTSSFNFVPERYELDYQLINELKNEGFEVGIHGLKHDGKLFSSRREFDKRVQRINGYLTEFNAVGFRAPLTHRNPYWMQSLNIEYDLSFFDTDPFEPIPGGTMSIWPFILGNFVELPYTLPQDYTLIEVLNEKSPKLWLDKVDFIKKYHGMVLLNSHPDYLLTKENLEVYASFLAAMKNREDYWHALPREVASWWKRRITREHHTNISTVKLDNNELIIVT